MAANKGLTLSMVFEAESANYGEGFGNISVLKKMTRGNGETYTYISRQAMRYCIVQQLGWDNTPLYKEGSNEKSVVQFAPEASVDAYPEVDLFGYMKTVSGAGATTRPAVARLSNAISLEPYRADTDYLTNMGLAKRIGASNSIAQREIHHAFYAYTVTADLDRVGVDREIAIPEGERSERMCALLDTLAYLYRDIAGRRENLAPVFVIGGVYDRKNPYFENRIGVKNTVLDVQRLVQIIADDDDVQKNTISGMLAGTFKNEAEIQGQLSPLTIGRFFAELKARIGAVYNG